MDQFSFKCVKKSKKQLVTGKNNRVGNLSTVVFIYFSHFQNVQGTSEEAQNTLGKNSKADTGKLLKMCIMR